ncbi:4'-phosphopantetheinyl transferase family protein [Streptomyces sp. NPDC054804]
MTGAHAHPDAAAHPPAAVAGGPVPGPARIAGPDAPWGELGAVLGRFGHAVLWSGTQDWQVGDERELGLSQREFARAAVLSGRRRSSFVASRLLLRHAAAHALGAAPADIDVARAPEGRPFLRGCEELDVSVSHTGDLAVVALSRSGRVGVDVESAARTVGGLGEEVLTAPELAALAHLPDARRARALLRLWTLKEAYAKALGHGLRLPFASFGFIPLPQERSTPAPYADGPVRLVTADGALADAAGWRFRTRGVAGDHVLALALGPGPHTPPPGLDAALAAAVLSAPRPAAVRETGPRTTSPCAAAAAAATGRSRAPR